MNRVTWPAAALLVAIVGCTSTPESGSAKAEQKVDDGALVAKANAAVAAPGTQVAQASSSVPGITTWTAYLGDAVTVFGTDTSGQRKAAMVFVFELDATQAPQGLVCSVSEDLGKRCSDIVPAMTKDFGGTPPPATATLHGQSLHPLITHHDDFDDPPPRASTCDLCKGALGMFFNLYDTRPGATEELDPEPQAACSLVDRPRNSPAQCSIWHLGVGSRAGLDYSLGTGNQDGAGAVAQSCCRAPNPLLTHPMDLPAVLGTPVEIVVNGQKASIRCEASEPVCQ
jgi:hypothetical protein